MIVISDSQKIDFENPFYDDILKNRKKFGKSLEKLIEGYGAKEPLVIGLDGQWGEGKTFFLKRWRQDLKNANKKTIYLDAFQSDYIQDPFFAIINEIYGFLEDVQKSEPEGLKEQMELLADKTTAVGSYIAKQSLNIFIQKIVGVESATEEIIKVCNIGSNPLLYTAFSENFINKYQDYKNFNKDFESFKDHLQKCAEINCTDTKFPIVFIIDELDRCNPTYALELLEKIKHFFSVEGIVFILSMNRRQLENSIKNIYGIDSDANIYLHKFLTVDAKMPKTPDIISNSDTHYKYLCNYYSKQAGFESDISENHINWAILKKFNCNFRDCQKIFTYLSIIAQDVFVDYFHFLLATLKVKKADYITKLQEDTLTHIDLIDNGIGYSPKNDNKSMHLLIKTILLIWEIPEENQKYLDNYDIEPNKIITTKKEYAKTCEILDLFKV